MDARARSRRGALAAPNWTLDLAPRGSRSVGVSVILVSTDRRVTYVPVRLGAGGGLTHRFPVGRFGLTFTGFVARRRPSSASVT